MTDFSVNYPIALARRAAEETAEDAALVGDFLARQDLGEGVYDFRFSSLLKGYEQWQWAVSLYHDAEAAEWTINETSLLPTQDALLAPEWVAWKDRLKPDDLSVTDSIGTDSNDPRMEKGVDERTVQADIEAAAQEDADADTQADSDSDVAGAVDKPAGTAAGADSLTDELDAIRSFRLTRHHVLSPFGLQQTAQRWYDGPHGPKALSTRTARGHVCETCAFFIPVQGAMGRVFGVCANKWSPDDGRVVSVDHGCGEHSEIVPPQPESMWPDNNLAYDDTRIDIIESAPSTEPAHADVVENLDEESDSSSDSSQSHQ